MPVYADVLAGNNITITPSGTDFVVATTDDVSLNKVTVGSVELDKTTSTVKVGTNTTLSTAGLNTDGSVNAGTLTTTGSATIGNGLTVANGATALKNTNIAGTLTTTGNTTVGGTLGVTGATTLSNTLNVVGNTTLSNVTTTGSATIGNGLTVSNGTTALKNTSITGTLATTGNTTVGGTLGVTGATTLSNTLNVVGNTTLSNVTTTGSATIGNGLTVSNGTTALKNTSITGTLATTGNTTVGGTLNVNGSATFNNGANLNDKKITGLAAGNISNASSTDAVNGGQLYTVNKNIADVLGTQLDANGTLQNPTYTVSDGKGGTQAFNNVRQAIEYITGVDTGTGTGGVGVGIKYFHTNSAAVDSQSKGLESVAIGPQAIANGTSSIAMGDQARADQENAVAIGKQSAAIGLNSTAIGSTTGTPRQPVYTRDANSKITAIDGMSVTTTGAGTNLTDITEINGVSVTNAQVTSLVALLSSGANLSLGKNSIALGTSNLARGESSVALGDSSKAVAKDAIAIGRNGNASGEQAISIGAAAQAAASGALAAGGASNAGRDGAVALGQGAFANTTAGISIGQNAGVGTSQGATNDRTDHIAIGRDSGKNVIGNRNIALGVGAGSNLSASGNDSSDDNIAIGVNAGSNLNGDDNIAIGRDANKNITAVAESVAIGSRVDATTGSTVLGNEAKASGGDYATVLGYKAKVTGDSGTALGRDSEASTNNIALGASSVANGTSTAAAYLTADTKSGGYNIVSVGKTGQERRITNVAAGANLTDAVNVNQLYEAQKNVASLIGGQTGVDPVTGAFTGYIIELTDTKTNQTHQYTNVASAINAVSSGAISVLPGNTVTYAADGRISNVAAGTQATDAVNLAQLNQAIADNGQHHVSINSKNPANENNMGATADESLAIGAGVTTSNAGVKSVVIGFDAATNAKESVAIGNTSTQANGDASIAIGKTALAKSTNNIAMGTNASSNGMESIAIGTNIQIDRTTGISDYAVGIGSYSEVQNADQAIAIGRKAIVQGDNGTAIGHESLAAKENASALGNFAKATAVSANAIGNYATASGTSANAIGNNAKATAGNANAMGKSAEATSTSSNAIGDSAKAAADNASAIGTNAQATGVNANAMGKGAKASEQDASAIGTGAEALRQDTLALGTSAVASGLNASAIGKSADAAGLNANAFGNGAKAGAESSNAIGTGANVSATNGFALGTGATVTHTNAVALGSGSISGNATPTASAIVNGKTYNYAGINPTSTVSVGSLGNERQIINVAAGRVSGSSTDAINGSQLFQTNEELANLANKTAQALGGGASANQATGAISAPSYTVTTNPAGTGTKTTVSNVGAALTALDTALNQPLSFAGDTGTQISRKLGETLNVKGGATGTLAATGNIGVVANGTNQLDIRLAETINLGSNGSVTTGSASIKNNEVKVGTNTLTDTGLKAGNVKVNTSTNDVTGLSNTTWNPAGTYNSGRAATEEQLISAQNQLNTTLTDKGFSISAQGANLDKVKLGETVDFRNTDGNLVVTHSADNTINYDLAKNINVDKVTLGNIVIDKATGINAGNQKITNVKAGDVNSTSTDAVNGSQLYTAQDNVKNVLGSSTQIDATGNLTSTNIGGVTGANTVHDAIQQVNNTATNAKTQADKGLNFAVNGVSPADNVQLGETVNFADGTNTTATYDSATNTYKYSLKDTLSLSNAGSLSIKDSAGTGTVVSVDKTGVQSGSIKLDASTGKITGVTDGLVAAGSKEAVNGGQLDAVKAIANTGWKLTTDKTGTGAVAGSSVEQITPDETV
ncbi:beta strand repeat-containing protein, partial [Acinetobacter sp. SwsAc5]|uniref:beta strand repeat-containing protein n=1 Tax=Acinetobacter sp. SwsAc5 TaxID=2749438 RepID=UPI003561EF1A